MPDYILDACALIAIYNNEPGRDVVENLLDHAERGEVRLAIHAAQLIEVLYDRIRIDGPERTGELAGRIYETYPVTVLEPVDQTIVLEASRLKAAGGRMSFADALLVATAACTGATIVTSDWTELEHVAEQGGIPFLWIRPKPEPKTEKRNAGLKPIMIDEFSAAYITAKALSTRQTPAEIVHALVSDSTAASA